MSIKTKIEWCDSTVNWWHGCTKISPGCAHCYAAQSTPVRVQGTKWGKGQPRRPRLEAAAKELMVMNRRPWVCDGAPIQAQAPDPAYDTWHRRRIFHNSLSDWLDDEVPISWLAQMLNGIFEASDCIHILLTKRPENWRSRLNQIVLGSHQTGVPMHVWEEGFEVREMARKWYEEDSPPPNVWIMTSVENQEYADKRIPELLKIPATVHGLSLEPLLGPVSLAIEGLWKHTCEKYARDYMLHADDGKSHPEICRDMSDKWMDAREGAKQVSWLVCGGESSQPGQPARPCDIEWIRSLVKQGKEAGCAVFVKQLGSNPITDDSTMEGCSIRLRDKKGGDPSEWPEAEDLRVREWPS